ncbi:hypothetical protein [Leisingera aquimarina]|nr:hypothetical protein [Leisingera aquimarina]
MAQIATVNYHVHKPERQSFELDAGGIVGEPDFARACAKADGGAGCAQV